MSLRLYKKEKLCSHRAVEFLFSHTPGEVPDSALVYPWRAVWRVSDSRPSGADDIAQFLITVPKKRVRHAVDRVLMRRRCREAYRLNRHLLPPGVPVDVAFVYVGRPGVLASYKMTERSITRLMSRIADSTEQ